MMRGTFLRRLPALLLIPLAIVGCAGAQASQVRGEALASTRAAQALARERPDMISTESEPQALWTETLLSLDGAEAALAECEDQVDDCLAAGLSQLLDTDRQLSLLEQSNGIARQCDFQDLQAHTRQAAGQLYVYFYGERAADPDQWRGPPTPRPPGVCPG
jgi:hypothetical protein